MKGRERGDGARRKHGARGKPVWLNDATHASLKHAAEMRGVSMSAYVANRLLELRTPFPPSALIAAPLARVGYLLTQIADALEQDDAGVVRRDVEAARRVVAETLLTMREQHKHEARSLKRYGEDWSG